MAAATTSRENLSAALTTHLIIGLLRYGKKQISYLVELVQTPGGRHEDGRNRTRMVSCERRESRAAARRRNEQRRSFLCE
jgi:hypothetical protein